MCRGRIAGALLAVSAALPSVAFAQPQNGSISH
jgi:hypothetical protein